MLCSTAVGIILGTYSCPRPFGGMPHPPPGPSAGSAPSSQEPGGFQGSPAAMRLRVCFMAFIHFREVITTSVRASRSV